MSKIYDTKPCQIEAIQFTKDNKEELQSFCGDDICYNFSVKDDVAYCWIHTLEGEMQATENDYIIKENNLDKIIKDVILKNKDELLLNDINIETNIKENKVLTDSKWLEFILNQIINNSIKYKKDNDSIIKIE